MWSSWMSGCPSLLAVIHKNIAMGRGLPRTPLRFGQHLHASSVSSTNKLPPPLRVCVFFSWGLLPHPCQRVCSKTVSAQFNKIPKLTASRQAWGWHPGAAASPETLCNATRRLQCLDPPRCLQAACLVRDCLLQGPTTTLPLQGPGPRLSLARRLQASCCTGASWFVPARCLSGTSSSSEYLQSSAPVKST